MALFGLGEATTHTGHVFALGFADSFLKNLGMEAAAYMVMPVYKDSLAVGLTHLYHGGDGEGFAVNRSEYVAASLAYFLGVVSTFPHDTFMRVFYTMNKIGGMPIIEIIKGPVLLAAFPILWILKLRPLLFLMGSFAVLAATLSLQFQSRHAFYMSIFGAMFVALLVAIDAARRSVATHQLVKRLATMAAVLTLAWGAMALVSASLASWQRAKLLEIADRYAALDWRPVAFRASPGAIAPVGKVTDSLGVLSRITVSRDDCSEPFSLAAEYDFAGARRKPQGLRIPSGVCIATIYTPLLFQDGAAFQQMQVKGIAPDRVRWSVAQFPPGTLPIDLVLYDGEVPEFYRGGWADVWEQFIRQ